MSAPRSIRVRALPPEDLARWDDTVRQFPAHRVGHTRAWINSLAAAGHGQPHYLVAEDGDDIVACLPGLVTRIAGFRLFGSPLPGWQTASMGPLFHPSRLDTDGLVSALLPYLERTLGVQHVELMLPGLDPLAMRRHGFRGEPVFTYRAPLFPEDEAATFARLKDSARRNIRRAERLGVNVIVGVDPGFVGAHYAQLREVYLRGGNEIPFSERRLAVGVAHLHAAGKLIAVSAFLPGSDERIATATFLVEGDELQLWMWAHSPAHRWFRVTELLTWRVMQWAMAAGCRSFDLMGRGEFKAKFGAVPDESKTRWIRSTSPVLAVARPVAKHLFHVQQVVRGRAGQLALNARAWTHGARRVASRRTPACVLGDIDLVRALGLAGVRSTVVAPPGAASRYSRHTASALPWVDPFAAPDRVVDLLLRFAETQKQPPTLFYQDDVSLLLVSRHRERLAGAFRFVAPDAELVEDLVDKARFQQLARRLDLPVPAAVALHPARDPAPTQLPFDGPFIVKPLMRRPESWTPIAGASKALLVDSPDALERLWPAFARAGVPLLAQELVPGPETAIESYHVYVDAAGVRAAEFTGRKIRTYPTEFGDSSALEISDVPELRDLGRALVARLGIRGVAKLDFKRRANGSFALLEVNPRFTLWHHPAAIAGVNIPGLVHADLTGERRATAAPHARPGVQWCKVWTDHAAARALGVPFLKWLRWAVRCEAKRAIAWGDPLPLFEAAARSWLSRAATVVAAIVVGVSAACSGVAAPDRPPVPPVVLMGAGDIATCTGDAPHRTAALLDDETATVFTTGDNLHDPAAGATYAGCYGPSWGRVVSRTLPAIGNHDYDYDAGARYFEYFGAAAGPTDLGYYSVNLGAWHVVVLNSNSDVVPTAVGSLQERWLRDDLARSSARCTLALWHHPRFYHGTFNRNANVRPFWAALLAAEAEIVVNGHFHLYERYAAQDADGGALPTRGIRQFTVGTGGRTLDALHQAAPNLEFRQNVSFGVLMLTLGDGWYEWRYLDTDRQVLDSGRDVCH